MNQTEQVKNIIEGESMTIQEIHIKTGILKPNIRRILGQGTIKGIFKRIKKGLYTLNK